MKHSVFILPIILLIMMTACSPQYDIAPSFTAERFDSIEAFRKDYPDTPLYVPVQVPEGAEFSHISVYPNSYAMITYDIPVDASRVAPIMYTTHLKLDPKLAIPNLVLSDPELYRTVEYRDKTIYYAADRVESSSLPGEYGASYYILTETDGWMVTVSIPVDVLQNGKKTRLEIEDALEYIAAAPLEIPK